jgi:SlyX protein
MSLDERVTELETRLAFQDDTLHALNDVVAAQQRQIDLLEMKLAALVKRQQELSESIGGGGGEDEAPPPHY